MKDPAPPASQGFVLPTPTGALRVASGSSDGDRSLLRSLLRTDTTLESSLQVISGVVPGRDVDDLRAQLGHLYHRGLIELHDRPYRLGDNRLETALPTLLGQLSATGRGLLADNEGFLVAAVGHPAEQADQMAALAAEVARLALGWHERLGQPSPPRPLTWMTVEPGREITTTFHVLIIGRYPFVLVLEAATTLVSPAFVWLAWALTYRYDLPAVREGQP